MSGQTRLTCAVLALGIIAGLADSGSAQLADSPWPERGNTGLNQGVSAYVGPNSDPVVLWSVSLQSHCDSGPVLGPDGNIYVGSGKGLMSVTTEGVVRWELDVDDQIYTTPAVAADGTIYFGGHFSSRQFYAVLPDGSIKWQYEVGDRILSSPVIGPDGIVYCTSSDGYVHALNSDGSLAWKTNLGGHYFVATPALSADGTLYVGGPLAALDSNDGSIIWSTSYGGYSSPAIGDDGTIYAGSVNDQLLALNPDGTTKWTFRGNDRFLSSPAIASDGTIYIGCFDQTLYAVNPDGTLKWSHYDALYEVTGSPMIDAAGNIYVQGSRLRCFAPDGTLLWELAEGWGGVHQPILDSNGVLYSKGNNSTLIAVIPEPATLAVLAIGGLALLRRRRQASRRRLGLTSGPAPGGILAFSFLIPLILTQTASRGDLPAFPITTHDASASHPSVSGNIVVWSDARRGYPEYDIYGFDLTTCTEFPICTDEHWQGSVDISGDVVAWLSGPIGASNPSLKIHRLSDHAQWDLGYSGYYPAVDGDIVVWADWTSGPSDICGFNLSTNERFPICTDPQIQNNPDIDGDIVVWKDRRGEDADIYGYDLKTGVEFPICTHEGYQGEPAISGNIVVWSDFRKGNGDIYGMDLETQQEFALVTHASDQDQPEIDGNWVVWYDQRNGNTDVYGYDLSRRLEMPISTHPTDLPRGLGYMSVSGDHVVWTDNRDGDYDIYAARLGERLVEIRASGLDVYYIPSAGNYGLGLLAVPLGACDIEVAYDVESETIEGASAAFITSLYLDESEGGMAEGHFKYGLIVLEDMEGQTLLEGSVPSLHLQELTDGGGVLGGTGLLEITDGGLGGLFPYLEGNFVDVYIELDPPDIDGFGQSFVGVCKLTIRPVPEPATLMLLGLGGSALLRRRRRK